MKNKNKTIWSNRFKVKISPSFQKIGSSINIDKRLYEQDVAASIVHTQMLIKQKIIKSNDGIKIINGLKKIKNQIDKGQFNFQEKFEDIHLNIEKNYLKLLALQQVFFIQLDQEMIKWLQILNYGLKNHLKKF